MCRQKHTVKFINQADTCQHAAYIAENRKLFDGNELPIDEEGFCLFHSSNNAWKLKKKFGLRMQQLLTALSNDSEQKNIDFRDFRFVSQNGEKTALSALTTTKPLNLCGAHFQGDLEIKSCHFSGELYMDKATVEGVFSLEECIFTTSFTAIQGTAFNGNIYFRDVVFHDLFDWNGAQVSGQFSIADVRFEGYTVWENMVNKSKDYVHSYFSFTTEDYMSFKNTEFHGNVQFENCIFNGDVHFTDTLFKQPLYITNPKIAANIFFKGTSEDSMLFESEVNMQIRASDFEGTGQMIFEYANLINLDKDTKAKLAELKLNRHVVLGEGTPVFRTNFRTRLPFSELSEVFIRDIFQTIQQYFKRNLGKHFEFIFTKESDHYWVNILTDDYLNSEDFVFEKDLAIEKLAIGIFDDLSDKVNQYLHEKLNFVVNTAIRKSKNDDAEANKLKQALLEIIGEGKLKIILNANNLKSVTAETLRIGTVKSSKFYINQLENFENDPMFELSSVQFNLLKEQLSGIQETERWEKLEKLLISIDEGFDAKNSLSSFLSDSGVSIVNGITSKFLFQKGTQFYR